MRKGNRLPPLPPDLDSALLWMLTPAGWIVTDLTLDEARTLPTVGGVQ